MNKAQLETAIRNDILNFIREALAEKYQTDVLPVSASGIMMPCVDAEGNDKYAVVNITIPRGTRVDGSYEPYDGYEAAKEYARDCEEKAATKAARKAKKEAEEQAKEARRIARAKKKETAE